MRVDEIAAASNRELEDRRLFLIDFPIQSSEIEEEVELIEQEQEARELDRWDRAHGLLGDDDA